MSALPTELWLLVCEQLCTHCERKEMPDFSLPQYEQGKSALAALCLTSQAMKDISQPVLYHCMYHYPEENTASEFLRALIFRPRLAGYVRVLSLPRGVDHETECDARGDVHTWHQVSSTLQIPTPRWVIRALSEDGPSRRGTGFEGPGQDSHLRYSLSPKRFYRASEFRAWKQLIILGLCCSGLTHLAISDIDGPVQLEQRVLRGPPGPRQHLVTPFNFPNLRVFSCERESFCEDYPWFFSQAPRLHRIAVGRMFFPRFALAQQYPPAPLTNISALSMVTGPSYQARMLQLFNQVRDLEIHMIDDTAAEALTHAPYALADPWPDSIKTQLRRLCWSYQKWWRPIGDEFLGSFPPLRDLKNLEILEIDRESLSICLKRGLDPNMPEDEVVKQLPTVLPSSIRILHIAFHSYSWATLLIQLDELAAAKKTCLPMLSLIQFDQDEWFLTNSFLGDRNALLRFMEALGVVSALKELGIELRIGLQLSQSFSNVRNSMLPPVPGNMESHCPALFQRGATGVTFPLED